MPTELHCSACDALIAPGNQFCPGCGLQLTAQAVPAVYTERRFPGWYIAFVFVMAFVGICYIGDQVGQSHQAKVEAARAATFHARAKALDAIATPAAFQARCGRATRIETHVAGLDPDTIVLDYPESKNPNASVLQFAFGGVEHTLGAARASYGGSVSWFTDTHDSPGVYAALKRIGCRLP